MTKQTNMPTVNLPQLLGLFFRLPGTVLFLYCVKCLSKIVEVTCIFKENIKFTVYCSCESTKIMPKFQKCQLKFKTSTWQGCYEVEHFHKRWLSIYHFSINMEFLQFKCLVQWKKKNNLQIGLSWQITVCIHKELREVSNF